MTAWLTTEAVFAHLGISRDSLMVLTQAPNARPAWSLYAGQHGTRSARYRWRADRLDDWFEEVCAWRASSGQGTAGVSGGETEAAELAATNEPSAPSDSRKRSRSRSKTRSKDTGGTSLVELAARLTSR